ncbi:MAG TPA: LptE family protein [bacterium]|uniref:Lipopolysaccharide-assembly n=1 Tax=candidate division TA06 bacterium ADurb.Bin417 TaxID=1852828 RepID=A0A1V5MJM5_UNCT6|nr:MAG: hypothetical protein BWY73_00305 [candidate division TA06 bacterium ADurb.Bin417]HNQ34800.1 LptE family protein [bacterium]HNS48521.1 LptE family protein [bacterium]
MKNFSRTLKIASFIIGGFFLAAGCGYRNLSRPRLESLHLAAISNQTMEPGVEIDLVRALGEEILRAGIRLEPGGAADWRLSGSITGYQRRPLTFKLEDPREVSSYRLVLSVRFQLSGPASEASPGSRELEKTITVSRDFPLYGSAVRPEKEIVEWLTADLAKRAVDWLAEVRP